MHDGVYLGGHFGHETLPGRSLARESLSAKQIPKKSHSTNYYYSSLHSPSNICEWFFIWLDALEHGLILLRSRATNQENERKDEQVELAIKLGLFG